MFKHTLDVDRCWSNPASLHAANDLCFQDFVQCNLCFGHVQLFLFCPFHGLWHRIRDPIKKNLST